MMLYSAGDDAARLERCLALAEAIGHIAPSHIRLLVTHTSSGDARRLPSGVIVVELPLLPGPIATSPPGALARVQTNLRLLTELARDFAPHTVVVDGDPLGLHGELAPALAGLLTGGAPVAVYLLLGELELIRRAGEETGRSWLAQAGEWSHRLLVFGKRESCEPFLDEPLGVELHYVAGIVAAAQLLAAGTPAKPGVCAG
jgi:predicted glycosyltransferase